MSCVKGVVSLRPGFLEREDLHDPSKAFNQRYSLNLVIKLYLSQRCTGCTRYNNLFLLSRTKKEKEKTIFFRFILRKRLHI